MAGEHLVACALPHSASEASDFHVSLFLSPTIVSAAETRLRDWSIFPKWGARAKSGLDIVLLDQAGPIACEPLLDLIDPDLWKAVFPRSLKVRTSAVPKWQNRRWRSFAARQVHDLARALHVATIMASPTSPPLPSAHPLAEALERLIAKEEYYRLEGSGRQVRRIYDESVMTRDLDRLIESREGLAAIERAVAAEPDWLKRMALQLHRCRRYYERPESQDEYRDVPLDGVQPPAVDKPEAEFHERCVMAGDHPDLMRRLGLVIDLKALDPDRLRRSQWLSARIAIDGDSSPCRSPRVLCRSAGDDLVTRAATADWADGALQLGDEARFAVLTLDTDGSAIKTERFLWTLPRLLHIERNGDPANAATPALRSPGFTVAGTGQALLIQDRLERQRQIVQALDAGAALDLHSEDVMRGFRVEVWDDEAGKWSSLHRRISDVTVEDFGPVPTGPLEEEGFIQGTAAHETPGAAQSPIHVHDALFGWEGWSLSAPRPGKRVRHEAGDEIVEETPETPPEGLVHPVTIRSRVQPGTLPRLRYGRSYAFRAWGVDLAGNSRPHALNPAPAAPPDALAPPDAPDAAAEDENASALRTAAHLMLERRRFERADTAPPQVEGEDGLDPAVLDHVRAKRGAGTRAASPLAQVSRHSLVTAAFAEALADPQQPLVADTFERGAKAAALVASHAAAFGGEAEGVAALAAKTVTALHPFLRWEPVPSPAVVPRRRYTEGESLRVLVVRSGVTQDLSTLALKISGPANYAAAAEAEVPDVGYGATSERHLAPPKIPHVQAEHHGMFDEAIGSTDPADHRRMLGWSLRENGTFQDVDRADLANPPGRVPQPGIAIVHVGKPTTELKALPLAAGETPAPGQTVIHDVDALGLPYLPDPMAEGVSLVFAEAARDRAIPFPFGTEGFTAAYRGAWPEIEPFRLVLAGGAELDAGVDKRVMTLTLPPGDVQKFRLASSLKREKLDLMGPWRSLPATLRADRDVAEAAADGWLWGLSPFEEVMLVHATDRPIEIPRPIRLTANRVEGGTHAWFGGAVDLHGPSTDSLSMEAAWLEPVDDLTLPEPEWRSGKATAFRTQVREHEDIALLGGADFDLNVPSVGRIAVHKAVHEFGDTRHRMVDYRLRAATRFREYFRPELLAPDTADPLDDGQSVVGPLVRLSVPSSARPAPPMIHSVIPLFRWSDLAEPEQPMARRRSRRAGLRIYLERGWYSSGEGELLGVLLAAGGDDSRYPTLDDPSGFPFVSKWGGDPVWKSAAVERRAMNLLQLDNLLRAAGLDDRPAAGQPVRGPVDLPLAALEGAPAVTVLGYEPVFNKARRLWHVDLAFDPADRFWPFVRLAVASYQPESIAGCHLSAPVRCDFVQLPPERMMSVSRTDARHVRVVVSGAIGLRRAPDRLGDAVPGLAPAAALDRTLVARIQRRDPLIPTDLGWKTVAVERMALRGRGDSQHEAAWVGELDAGEDIALERPQSGASDWRVTVEEWETIESDPIMVNVDIAVPQREARLIYADEMEL